MTPAELLQRASTDLERRLWSRVAIIGDCWEWQGVKVNRGYKPGAKIRGTYGQISIDGRLRLTHRLAYQLCVGPVPEGLFLLHSCDNPPCVNPAHLSPGTIRDNALDMSAKGRARGSMDINRDKTHCPHGHPYSGPNLYIRRNGKRVCRICQRRWHAETYVRQKERLAQRDLRPEDRAA